MGEGVADPSVGKWDQELFDRFRAAAKGRRTKVGKPLDPAGALRRRLKDQLLRIHSPLVITLVHQVQGNAPPDRLKGRLKGRVRTAMHLVGARNIEWDQAFNLGLFACGKALETLDLAKGSFSGYLLKKVFYELQCEVGRMNLIKVDRGAKPMGMDYLEDDEQLGRLELEEEPDPEAPQIRALEEKEEKSGPLVPAIAPPLLAAAIPLVVVPIVDEREWLQFFLEEVCRFAPASRTASSVVRGRSHALASARGEYEIPGALGSALREHGVRPITMRVPWCEEPVKGLRGMWLQSTPPLTPIA